MTREDRDELRSMILTILEAGAEKTNGKFEVIKSKLDAIEVQTTKTNGRVTKLEQITTRLEFDEANHANVCPHLKKIEALERTNLTEDAIKKFIIKTIGITISIMTVAISIFEIFIR